MVGLIALFAVRNVGDYPAPRMPNASLNSSSVSSTVSRDSEGAERVGKGPARRSAGRDLAKVATVDRGERGEVVGVDAKVLESPDAGTTGDGRVAEMKEEPAAPTRSPRTGLRASVAAGEIAEVDGLFVLPAAEKKARWRVANARCRKAKVRGNDGFALPSGRQYLAIAELDGVMGQRGEYWTRSQQLDESGKLTAARVVGYPRLKRGTLSQKERAWYVCVRPVGEQ